MSKRITALFMIYCISYLAAIMQRLRGEELEIDKINKLEDDGILIVKLIEKEAEQ